MSTELLHPVSDMAGASCLPIPVHAPSAKDHRHVPSFRSPRYFEALYPKALIAKLPAPNEFLVIMNSESPCGANSSTDRVVAASGLCRFGKPGSPVLLVVSGGVATARRETTLTSAAALSLLS